MSAYPKILLMQINFKIRNMLSAWGINTKYAHTWKWLVIEMSGLHETFRIAQRTSLRKALNEVNGCMTDDCLDVLIDAVENP